jgi:hypothetical protein
MTTVAKSLMKNFGVESNNDKDSLSVAGGGGGEGVELCVQQRNKVQFKETNLFFVSPDTRFL